ncbi:DUF1857-domain-containing protein [Ophiobolus disseminans]|uniref:DUF1857-domain-containing protein n=1 Tax=Ophiobolus disseminans TaxID=1469910 RepID=A0A6A7AKK4_9PLEO|nr:DUF1857-domain-containing protein [Ophiobolus disseminans]
MAIIHLAYTGLINPSGASPVLTRDQVWQGLQRKIRFAQEFVPIITSCTVLTDTPTEVTREVVFKEGAGPKPRATETVRSYWPSWVDFHQEDGTLVKNVISNGSSLDDGGLCMTYVFEFKYDGMEDGSKEIKAEVVKMSGMSKMAVEKSIETIRQMVVDGKIK